ncbi:MAG: 2-C-methyl-D-erythritol 4-phosphate cytidylyltransferase [Rhodocyclaceae bacterium]|nr:2-C-methyl-D-erythritol 4-phosphate cytidylyltransferase [Rhodocyclaceae bacterium]
MAERYFAVVPAAGGGTRLGAAEPKQYLDLGGDCMLYRSLDALLAEPRIAAVTVVLAPDDERRPPSGRFDGRVRFCAIGGATRADSVAAGLHSLSASEDDWVLVHDAARPGLSAEALARLIDTVGDDPVGGLLALPVADTLKRGDASDRVTATVERAGLWAAQTPQLFRAGLLRRALAGDRAGITDEASAVERLGLRPLLVRGEPANLKVTLAADLALAQALLSHGGA